MFLKGFRLKILLFQCLYFEDEDLHLLGLGVSNLSLRFGCRVIGFRVTLIANDLRRPKYPEAEGPKPLAQLGSS